MEPQREGKNISHPSGYETLFGNKAQINSEMCMLTTVTPENVILKLRLEVMQTDILPAQLLLIT